MERKEKLTSMLYELIMEKGTVSTRANELYTQTDERIENKVYVKKFQTDDLTIEGTKVKILSVASEDETFSHTSSADVRIGCENRNNVWTNVFATECDEDFLNAIITAIY